MAQQRPEEREVANGLAKDMNLKRAEKMIGRNPELQGYLLLGAGALPSALYIRILSNLIQMDTWCTRNRSNCLGPSQNAPY